MFGFDDIHGITGSLVSSDAVADDERPSEEQCEATNTALRRQGGGERDDVD